MLLFNILDTVVQERRCYIIILRIAGIISCEVFVYINIVNFVFSYYWGLRRFNIKPFFMQIVMENVDDHSFILNHIDSDGQEIFL